MTAVGRTILSLVLFALDFIYLYLVWSLLGPLHDMISPMPTAWIIAVGGVFVFATSVTLAGAIWTSSGSHRPKNNGSRVEIAALREQIQLQSAQLDRLNQSLGVIQHMHEEAKTLYMIDSELRKQSRTRRDATRSKAFAIVAMIGLIVVSALSGLGRGSR